jgi:hypothetical protein
MYPEAPELGRESIQLVQIGENMAVADAVPLPIEVEIFARHYRQSAHLVTHSSHFGGENANQASMGC